VLANPVPTARRFAGAALQPPAGALRVARRAEREVRGRVEDRLGRLGVALVDRALASPYPEEAMRHVLESPRLRYAVVAGLDSAAAERLMAVALESPGFDRLVTRVVASRVVDDAAARVADEVIRRLPESAAMWSLVEEVAGSPTVIDAMSRQGATFADHVADEVRDRSRTADARLERTARRVLWRRRHSDNGDVAAPVEAP
jgi:hypothetical protein